jgi:hypothetical protein
MALQMRVGLGMGGILPFFQPSKSSRGRRGLMALLVLGAFVAGLAAGAGLVRETKSLPIPLFALADRDCADFSSAREAQAFFDRAGPGDPHRLDDDGDGRACDRLR